MIYRNILSKNDVENLQIDLNRLGEWASENEMISNPAESEAVCFTQLFIRRHSNSESEEL
jgi:hypothetical protein